MATPLDLQEQEQLDTLKAFWKQYGNLVFGVLIVVLAAFAGWNGWQWWQRDQAFKAATLFDELERAAQAGDADKAGRVFGDLKDRYPRTAFAQQGGLLAAKTQFNKGQADNATVSLAWVADNAVEDEIRTVARLRLADLQAQAKKYDDALKMLDAAKAGGFEALVADRRGDVLLMQGKADAARASYQSAWAAMDPKLDYKRVVEAKLTALGAAPAASAAVMAASAAASGAAK